VSSNRGRRYSTLVVKRAQDLAEAGWTAHQIQKLLNKDGIPATFATVKAWIDPEYRRIRNHYSAEDMRQMKDVSGEHVKRRMLELRGAGLTCSAISVVVDIYHGRKISPAMVQQFLDRQRQAAPA
jgi:hypothetical protein